MDNIENTGVVGGVYTAGSMMVAPGDAVTMIKGRRPDGSHISGVYHYRVVKYIRSEPGGIFEAIVLQSRYLGMEIETTSYNADLELMIVGRGNMPVIQ